MMNTGHPFKEAESQDKLEPHTESTNIAKYKSINPLCCAWRAVDPKGVTGVK